MKWVRVYGHGVGQNEKQTLKRKVSACYIRSETSNLEREVAPGVDTPVNLWDVGARASQYLKPGDELYILCEDRLYYGSIAQKIHDAEGEIGDRVGWHRLHKQPWRNVLVFADLKRVSTQVLNDLGQRFELSDNFFKICPTSRSPYLN
jgi:hypothetical protein